MSNTSFIRTSEERHYTAVKPFWASNYRNWSLGRRADMIGKAGRVRRHLQRHPFGLVLDI